MSFNQNIFFQLGFATPPLVLLHAFPLHSGMWAPQIDMLRRKGIGFVTLDFPGFGNSSHLTAEPRITFYTERVYQLLRDLQITHAVLVSLSMGGYVALDLYRRHPEFFTGMVLANTRAGADQEDARNRRYTIISELQETQNTGSLIEQLILKFLTVKTRSTRPELERQVRNMMGQATLKGIIQAQQAMATRDDSHHILRQIPFPVLIITGANDELTPVSEACQMAERLQYPHLKIIKNAAHLSNLERPEAFNRHLLQYYQLIKKHEK